MSAMCGQCEATRDNKLAARVNVALRLAAWAARTELGAWLAEAHLGVRNERHGYTVTERTLGRAVVTFDDGSTRVFYAPVPAA